MNKELLWVESERPKTLEEVVLPEKTKRIFKDGLNTNILLSGTAGTGKTTLGKILCKGRSILFINASLETGIDTIREKVEHFAATVSLVNSQKKKVVFLDEADQLSDAAQKSLRGFIEKYHKNVVFILTANFPEKIIDPIRKSRVVEINFNWDDQENREVLNGYAKRINSIVEKKGYKIEKESIKNILKEKYPDFRGIINLLQSIANSLEKGETITPELIKKKSLGKNQDLYNFLLGNPSPEKTYSFIKSNYLFKEIDCLNELGTTFLDFLLKEKPSSVLAVAKTVHRHQYEMKYSVDKLICLLSCCAELNQILR